MARGLWKGAISFGLVNVPVELYSAQKRSAELDLTMLDKRDLAPVGYKRVNKASGKEVPWEDVVKGYEYEDEKYVVLSEEDFRRANPEAAKTGKAGIATVVIRTKQYLAALIPQDDALILNTLRYSKELKKPEDLEIPEKLEGHKPTSKELDMALRLIEDMADEWKPEKYHD